MEEYENHEVLVVNKQDQAPMNADAVKKQVQLIQQVMREVMIEGEHYGTIPGCGDKQVLFKAGAEKLAMTFRLCPEFHIQRLDFDNEHREFIITCSLKSASGSLLAQGVGSCSTKEKKYRYRIETVNTGVPVPKSYWKDRNNQQLLDEIEAGSNVKVKPVKRGGSYYIGVIEKKENPDLAETYNTVLKMAKKRAQVDATVTATAASDIFNQDLDEEEIRDAVTNPTTKTPKSVKRKKAAHQAPKEDGNVFAYKIEYGSDNFESLKDQIKKAGARWNGTEKVWETQEEIPGLENLLVSKPNSSDPEVVESGPTENEEQFLG